MAALQIVEMRVSMYCGGCEQKVRKTLSQLQGVDKVEIDMAMHKVTVTGYVDRKMVLEAVRGCGRKAELLPYPCDVEKTSCTDRYCEKPTFDSSYNYREHGCNGSSRGYYQFSPYCKIGEKITYIFSDENPHACTIM